jgi:hypothetical protein
MHVQNNNITPTASWCYILVHAMTNKFHPLNSWYDSLTYEKTCPYVTIGIPISTEKCTFACWLNHCPIWPTVLPLDLSVLHLFACYCFQWTWPIQTPNIPLSKSHIHFPSARSFQRIRPSPSSCVTFRNKLFFYSEEVLVPRPGSKLEAHLLSAVRDCLFNIFAATLHIRMSFPPHTTPGRVMPSLQGPT